MKSNSKPNYFFSRLGADSPEVLSECSEKERMNSSRIGASILLPMMVWGLGAGSTAWMMGGSAVAIGVSGVIAAIGVYICDSSLIAKASTGKTSWIGVLGRLVVAVAGSLLFAHSGIFPLASGVIDQEIERTKQVEIETVKGKLTPQIAEVQARLTEQTKAYREQVAEAVMARSAKNNELKSLREELDRWRAEADAEANGKRVGKEGYGVKYQHLMDDHVKPLQAREQVLQAELEVTTKALASAQQQLDAADKMAAKDAGLAQLQGELHTAVEAIRSQKHRDPTSCYRALHRVMAAECAQGDYTLTMFYVCVSVLLIGLELLPLGLKLKPTGEHAQKVRLQLWKAEQDTHCYVEAYPAVAMQLMQMRLRLEAYREELKLESEMMMDEVRAARQRMRGIILEQAEALEMAEQAIKSVPKNARAEHKQFTELLATQLIESFMRSVDSAMQRINRNRRIIPNNDGSTPATAA